MNNPEYAPMFVFVWMLIGGPFLLYGFHQYTLGIQIIREKYERNYEALGCPADFLPPKADSGSGIASQILLMKLIFVIPSSIPDDPEVLKKMKIIQLIGRLWNLVGLPIVAWLWIN